jgi:hypothetical protein
MAMRTPAPPATKKPLQLSDGQRLLLCDVATPADEAALTELLPPSVVGVLASMGRTSGLRPGVLVLPLLVATSAVVGGAVKVARHEGDAMRLVPTQWAVILGPPGTGEAV